MKVKHLHIKFPFLHVLLIIVTALLLFFINNKFTGGYLNSPATLGAEIQAPADALYEWHLSTKAPFKYRALFPAMVKQVWGISFEEHDSIGFYYVYLFISLLFYILVPVVFYFLLKVTGFSRNWSLLGAFLYFNSPAVYMAFTLPVHTREDMLAFTILCLGLILILKKKDGLFLGICLLGVCCRETLLILPFLFLFFTNRPLLKRLAFALLAGLVWLGLRWRLGLEQYDVLEGFSWNLLNPDQILGFTFITFHFMWISSFYYLLQKNLPAAQGELPAEFFKRSLPWVMGLVVVTTFFGGIFNEIRLLYLMFPWVVIGTLWFIRQHLISVDYLFRQQSYKAYVMLVLTLLAVCGYLLLIEHPNLLPSSQYAIPMGAWLFCTLLGLFQLLLVLPVLFSKNSQPIDSKVL